MHAGGKPVRRVHMANALRAFDGVWSHDNSQSSAVQINDIEVGAGSSNGPAPRLPCPRSSILNDGSFAFRQSGAQMRIPCVVVFMRARERALAVPAADRDAALITVGYVG